MAESEEEPKSLLMRVTEESEKAGLKLNIPETNIIVSEPISSWQRKGENGGNGRFSDLGLQNHCGRDCSHEIKRHLLLSKGRTAVPNLDSMLKSRDITC